jgi:hypothetical protein
MVWFEHLKLCVCVCVCERERERERFYVSQDSFSVLSYEAKWSTYHFRGQITDWLILPTPKMLYSVTGSG